MRVGFIGLGDQGGPMAEMMLAAGVPLSVWARREEALAPFVAAGARPAKAPDRLAAECDLLGLCVTSDDDVRAVLLGAGALEAMKPGAVVAVHATVRPSLCVELAELAARGGVTLIDAPVSGSGRAARARNLLVMVGGEVGAFEQVRPAFASFAARQLHMGPVGAAMSAKLINNLLSAVHIGRAYEALLLAAQQGVDPRLLREAVLAGTGRSFAMEALERFHEPLRAAHISRILAKDVALALGEMAPDDAERWAPLAQAGLDALDALAGGRGLS